ncbi:Y+L amino acid transporter 2-like 12 [Homarus americanus]|uniref:Y+L amino acid transporter 2-like 12 n=1 Tax=Homarus americanus TaxID=6706 RepID=A0A8J5MXJ3_HOMAM|nr:Y+L amino acid transporter 2-like 12 [Homarus americanus]
MTMTKTDTYDVVNTDEPHDSAEDKMSPVNLHTNVDTEAREDSDRLMNNLEPNKEEKDDATDSSSVRLKKELGLLEGVAVIVGIVVGSGIFVSPKGVLLYSGSVGMSLAVWVACGLLSMVGALCFTELGTMIPESGGMYSYLHRAFGPVFAFLYMWVTILTRNSAGTAVIAITFANYFLQLWLSDCETVPTIPARLIAAALIIFLTWLNCVNVRWVTKLQNVFTLTKVMALCVIICAGGYHLGTGHLENYRNPMAGTTWEVAAIATAFYQSLFSYTGWDYLNVVTEELKNPNRNLPLSIIISTTLITIIYVLTNVAYFAVLTPTEMLSSNAVAMTFASRMLGMLAWTMPVFVMCSTFGSTHASVFTQTRLIFVGARRGQFPQALTLGVTIVMMLVVPDISSLINYTAFSATAMQFSCICALFWFRYKYPSWNRPFKVWLVLPILFSLTQLFLLLIPIIMTPLEVVGGITVIITGLPVYYLTIYRQDIARWFSASLDQMTIICQKLFLCLPEDKED